MASKPQNSENTVYVQYCRSCETHNWCTHHDQAKYHDTYLKLSQIIAQRFPNLEVIGNMVPSHLIPFKIAENKYIDSQTNKYVVYPQIGSFQVTFNRTMLYSKKNTNAWPNLQSIASKIGAMIDPKYKQPLKIEKATNSPQKEIESKTEKQSQVNQFTKANDQKMTVYKDQSKGFTLTDHFKLYRPKQKLQDKDWLTEKRQSESSIKQFFQQYRGQSREKSDNSQDTKKKRDFSGQTKLKQMLKNKGLMVKEQGKKELVIKLDSIEQENAYYEEGNGATQRTQQISNKRNRMQELEDEFSSLENKFKNFENKVQDIHTKNKQFQYKQQLSNELSRAKQAFQAKNEEPVRKDSKKQQVAQKENYCFYQRFSKLDQYLNASEEEKNQKLHKIYGEWKLLKKTSKKNRKMLKNKDRNSQERDGSSDEQSQTHSNSPSYIGNVITFKPKKDKSNAKLGANSLKKQVGHKYSTLQKYENSKIVMNEPKFRTGEQFYSKNMKNKQNMSSQVEQQVHTSSKLLKKGLGSMSMEALKKMASKEALFNNNQKIKTDQISQFSEPAQKNIKHIQSRINDLQNKLKIQKQSYELPSFNKPTLDALQKVYSNKSKSHSQTSNYSSKNAPNQKQQKDMKTKKLQNNFRNSYRTTNDKQFRKINKLKGLVKNSQSFSGQYKRQGGNYSQAIQEQNEIKQSKYQSMNESKLSETENEDRYAKDKSSKKRNQVNSSLLTRQKLHQQSTNSLRQAIVSKNPDKNLKASAKVFNVNHPKKLKTAKKTNKNQERSLKAESELVQNTDKSTGKMNKSPQKQNKQHDYPIHEPVTYLRKQKDWKQSNPLRKQPKERLRRSSQQEQAQHNESTYEGRNEKMPNSSAQKLSDSKQTVIKSKNPLKSKKRQASNTPKTAKLKSEESNHKQKRKQVSNIGRIRKNKSRQQDQQKISSRDSNQREEIEQESYHQRQEDEVEDSEQQSEAQYAEDEQMNQSPTQYKENSEEINGNQEQTEQYIKVSTKSEQGQMKKTRGHNLSYHKFQEVCYTGQKRSVNQSNDQAYISSQIRHQSKESYIITPQGSQNVKIIEQQKKLSQKSPSEERNCQIITNANQAPKIAAKQPQSQQINQILKKSQDSQLATPQNHQPVNQQKVQPTQQAQQLKQSTKMQNKAEQQLLSEKKESEIVEKEQQEQLNAQQHSQLHDSKKILTPVIQKQVQNSNPPLEKQQQNKQKKEKKQKKQAKNKQKQEKNERKDEIVDLQELMVKQYSDYLLLKITSNLLNPNQNDKFQKKEEKSKETKQFLDCEIAINLINCPSASSFAVHQETIPCSFMDHKTTTQIKFIEHQAEVDQQAEEEEEESQQQYQADEYEFQELSQPQAKKTSEKEEEEDIQQSELNKYIIVLQNEIVLNPSPQSQDDKGLFESKQSDERPVKEVQNPIIIVSQISPKLQTLKTQENNPRVEESIKPHLIQATQEKLEKIVRTHNNSQPLKQQNNVYSQAKQVKKFTEIGIQKELTLQISVQTDHQPQDFTADVFMIRGSTMKSSESHKQPSSRQAQKRKLQLVQSIFQQSNPVKNNYFSQSRTQNMFQKKKQMKEIERAHIIDKIYSPNVEDQVKKFSNLVAGAQQDINKEQGPVIKMIEGYAKGELFSQKGLQVQLIQSRFTKLLKVVQILCQKSQWLVQRLFEDKNGVLKEKAFGVWLCKQYQWECILVDDSMLVNEENHPLYSFHRGNQMWFNVLEKAVTVALGGYENLMKAETGQLFTMLTGCNAIISKIKQDPSKNGKLLSLINECLRKNYVIHAEKSDKSKKQQSKQSIYYISSVRKAGGDEQTLIELSQNGRESFWIKLSKFVQQFCKIEILQLRINHNFTHLDLGVGRPGKLTVVQLDFQEDAQGCVTLTYLGDSGALRAFLYKQQKNKLLKLIGQAKQKSKSHLFFQCSFTEGKYYVFAQAEQRPSRIAYLGQTQPNLKITEEIHSQGLKNDMAQYLPVRDNEESKMKKSQFQSQNQWRSRKPRLQDNFVQSRLRENFVQYVLGKSKV